MTDHVIEHRRNCVEPLIRLADVRETGIIQQDLLHDEYRDRLGYLRARLHDPKAEWNDLCAEEKIYHLAVVVLDEGSDDTEGCQAQVFEGAGLGGRVQKWIEEKWDVGV